MEIIAFISGTVFGGAIVASALSWAQKQVMPPERKPENKTAPLYLSRPGAKAQSLRDLEDKERLESFAYQVGKWREEQEQEGTPISL